MTAIAQPQRPPTSARRQGTGPFSRFEFLVAGRYLRARRKDAFISVIAALTLTGIAIGVATLIVVMSVMNGFRDELLEQDPRAQRPLHRVPDRAASSPTTTRRRRRARDGRRRALSPSPSSRARRWPRARRSRPASPCAASIWPIDQEARRCFTTATCWAAGRGGTKAKGVAIGSRLANKLGRDHRRPGHHRQPQRHADAVRLDAADPLLPGAGHLRPRHGRVRQLLSLHAARAGADLLQDVRGPAASRASRRPT